MDAHGFYRVSAATIPVKVAHPADNVQSMLDVLRRATGSELVVFPELSITGYTCGDLFADAGLLRAARTALDDLVDRSSRFFDGVVIVGMPLRRRDRLFNVAVAFQKGRILAAVSKRFLPNYKEYYEQRWFAAGPCPPGIDSNLDDIPLDVGGLLIAQPAAGSGACRPVIGIEICEDLWVPNPPSTAWALAGANILVNLSASNEVTTKSDYRRSLVIGQSARLIAGYVYAAAGVTESTTDIVFGGHSMIAENGQLLAEAPRFQRSASIITADIDLERLVSDRMRMTTFPSPFEDAQAEDHSPSTRAVFFESASRPASGPVERVIPAHPFVPSGQADLSERCEEIFNTQVAGLAKRIEIVRPNSLNIGVSGGLDSTLALLVTVKTCDLLGIDRSTVAGLTMPGFGTSQGTYDNAHQLMVQLGVCAHEIDIRTLVYDTFRSLGHRPFKIDIDHMSLDEFLLRLKEVAGQSDLVFENVQARLRTMLLMSRGFVVGTGDLSELALGWATYNGDHMSMYNPNVSIPKTLVRFLVRWAADHEFEGPARAVLHSIADTEISPELLPLDSNGAIQSTEATVGPYELHDFFLYHMLRFGMPPAKIFRLARQASFDSPYSADEIRRWLRVFYQRFFSNQFKRSCLPDGPKVGSVSLSPRGDWRMPSDADARVWLDEIDQITTEE